MSDPKIDWSTVTRVGNLEPVEAKRPAESRAERRESSASVTRSNRPTERRGRSVIKAILSGASMKSRSCEGLTHAQIYKELLQWNHVLAYCLGLAAAASCPTRKQQVSCAAYCMVEMTSTLRPVSGRIVSWSGG